MYKWILHFSPKAGLTKDICYTFVAFLRREENGCFFSMYFLTGCWMFSSCTELEVLFGCSGLTFFRNVSVWNAAWWNYDFSCFPFLYQVSFILFKYLRLQHWKGDMSILLVLPPTWYLTIICTAHVFLVLGDDVEQGNLIMFNLCFTNDICHKSSNQYPPFICRMTVTLIFISTP